MPGEGGEAARALRGEGRDDFREHRAYVPGDDLRRIDWNLLGRLNELHTKHFEARVDVSIQVILDRSASMAAASSAGIDKDTAGRRLAGAMAYGLAAPGRQVQLRQLAGGGAFGAAAKDESSARRLLDLLETLAPPAGQDGARNLLEALPRARASRAGLVVVSTDGFGPAGDARRLRGIVERGERLVVVLWSTDSERSPATGESRRLRDLESGAVIDVAIDDRVLAAYLDARRQWRDALEQDVSRQGGVLCELDVAEPLELAVAKVMRVLEAARSGTR